MPVSDDTRGPLSADDQRRQLRWQVYILLIVVGLGIMAGRVMSVTARHQRTPFLSANDRSRIATMRALVDHGTFAIDEIIYETEDNGQIKRNAEGVPVRNGIWQTIDMVRHPDRGGVMRSYSSKPTLLPTLLAGEYWLVKQVTGATVGERPFYIGRVLLLLTNVLPMALYFVIMAVLIERWGRTDWGRLFAMTFTVLGTFLPTFAVTINNHLPAAVSAAIVVLAISRIWYDGDRRWFWFVLGGRVRCLHRRQRTAGLVVFLPRCARPVVESPAQNHSALHARRRYRGGRGPRHELYCPRQLATAVCTPPGWPGRDHAR